MFPSALEPFPFVGLASLTHALQPQLLAELIAKLNVSIRDRNYDH